MPGWRAARSARRHGETHYELATDTLYVEDGLIRYQTFAAKMTPQ